MTSGRDALNEVGARAALRLQPLFYGRGALLRDGRGGRLPWLECARRGPGVRRRTDVTPLGVSRPLVIDAASALAETLALVAEATSNAAHEWWVFGSAAVVLHGGKLTEVKDVDLLMSATDAEALLRRFGEIPAKGLPDERFRSSVFGTWKSPPKPVEVMGGFQVATPKGWQTVWPSTREPVSVNGRTIYVPSCDELVEILHAFGRPKDLRRASALGGLIGLST